MTTKTTTAAETGLQPTFYEQQNVGTVKYLVNYHDGRKTHADGSPFYAVALFSNRKRKDAFVNDLRARGYEVRP